MIRIRVKIKTIEQKSEDIVNAFASPNLSKLEMIEKMLPIISSHAAYEIWRRVKGVQVPHLPTNELKKWLEIREAIWKQGGEQRHLS